MLPVVLFAFLFFATQMTAELLYRSSWAHHEGAYDGTSGFKSESSDRVRHEQALRSLQTRSAWTVAISIFALAATLFFGFRGSASEWPIGVILATTVPSSLSWFFLGLSIVDDDVPDQRPYTLPLRILFTISVGTALGGAGLGLTSNRPVWRVAGGIALVGGLALSTWFFSLDWV